LLVYDQSQIEARFTVWFCGEQELLQAFRNFDAGTGEDVYRIMAAKIYGRPANLITSEERFIGKVCVLALGFGMGWMKLRLTLATGYSGAPMQITEEEARRIVSIYRASNPHIVRMWEYLNQILQSMSVDQNLHVQVGPVIFKYKMIVLPSGLSLKYPGLYTDAEGESSYLSRYGRTKIWGGMLLENIIQALARCVISDQMLEISTRWFIATMTHDEIVSLVPDVEIEEAVIWQKHIMTRPVSWAPDLPLAVEGGYDRRYSK